MGQSTDAYIAFGIDLSEDYDHYLLRGLNEDKAEILRDNMAKELAEFNLVLIQHCSIGYPMYILAHKELHEMASRGYPETITSLIADSEMIDVACNDFRCAKEKFIGLKDLEDPEWLLFSFWEK